MNSPNGHRVFKTISFLFFRKEKQMKKKNSDRKGDAFGFALLDSGQMWCGLIPLTTVRYCHNSNNKNKSIETIAKSARARVKVCIVENRRRLKTVSFFKKNQTVEVNLAKK